MSTFIAFGIDIVSDPAIGTLSGAGNDGAGQISLTGGSQIFADDQIVEFIVMGEDDNGELNADSRIIGIRVFDSLDAYNSGTVLYEYAPVTADQSAQVEDDLSGIGDTYLHFDADTLVSSDPGAPVLSSLLVAPGTEANDYIGSLVIDRDTDVDYSGDGTIQPGTIEEGNTYFNINYPTQAYGVLPDGVVTGDTTGQVMGLGYVDATDGDAITTGDDQIEALEGDDTIDADAGNDGVFAGGGDDIATGGAGDDWVLGEGGDDTLTIADGWGHDVIIGGETHETVGDTLDASAVSAGMTVDLSGADAEAGAITDGTNTVEFSEIETLVLGSGDDTLILGDGGGARVVGGFSGPTDNGDGTYSGIDLLDVTGLTNGSGIGVSTSDVTLSEDDNGNVILSFPGGETLTLLGLSPADLNSEAALEAIGIPANGSPVSGGGSGGGAGTDYIVSGTVGDDYIDSWYGGDPDGDRVDAGDAADGSDDDHIQAGDGNDTVLSDLGDDSIEGGAGDDRLEGGAGADTILGDEGADRIWGGEDDDLILGGDGNDTIEGNTGADYIEGGAGDDSILGDTGDDTIIGGDGNDWLRGSVGYDSMSGGTGDDYIWSGFQDDTISLEDNFGNDTIEMEDIDETTGDVLDASAVTSDLVVDLRAATAGVGTLSDGISTANFQGVEHLILGSGNHTIVLGLTSGTDVIQGFTAPTDNGDGTYTGHDKVNLTNMVNDQGDLIDTDDVTVLDDGNGNAILSFPGGETLTLIGVSPDSVSTPQALHAIGIPLGSGGGAGPDGIVEGTDGADLIDTAYTGDPEGDVVDGADGLADSIEAGSGDDTIVAGEGADTVQAGAGNDLIYGGAGADTLFGGEENDTLYGGSGNDALYGGTGDDVFFGGGGADQLFGAEGNDSFTLGSGDQATGGDGDDVFNVAASGGGDMSVDGGETGETVGDTLNITGPATITYDADNAENGTVQWLDGTTLHFSNIETVNYVPCFTPTSLIKTPQGERPAGLLQPGDLVLTRDNGFQPITWTGTRALDRPQLGLAPDLQPVLIRKGALGNNQPERDLLVSPQHRMLITSRQAALYFGEPEVFAPAIALTFLPGIRQVRSAGVTYVHFMMDRHQVVMGDGAWSESFQPGDMTLAGMDQAQRQELFTLFPELAARDAIQAYPAARVTLSAREARVLAS